MNGCNLSTGEGINNYFMAASWSHLKVLHLLSSNLPFHIKKKLKKNWLPEMITIYNRVRIPFCTITVVTEIPVFLFLSILFGSLMLPHSADIKSNIPDLRWNWLFLFIAFQRVPALYIIGFQNFGFDEGKSRKTLRTHEI